MNFSSYQWRAAEGYLPPPGSMPCALPWPAPHGPSFSSLGYDPSYRFYNGPVPLQGVTSRNPDGPPKGYTPSSTGATVGDSTNAPPPPKQPVAPLPPPPAQPTRSASANPAPSPRKQLQNPNAPPELRPGMNYMFPTEHTHLHIFNRSSRIWEEKFIGMQMSFKQFKASTNLTVRDVITNVLRASGNEAECADWAVTEVIEIGDGRWAKGSTTLYPSDRAARPIGTIGWTADRGEKRPPVWLVVHKCDK